MSDCILFSFLGYEHNSISHPLVLANNVLDTQLLNLYKWYKRDRGFGLYNPWNNRKCF